MKSDQLQSTVEDAAPELDRPATAPNSDGTRGVELIARGGRGVLGRSRLLVALALIAAGIAWAIARGLEFYGLNPVHIAYDLDQPPLLLVFVGAYFAYRNRRR